MTKKQHIKSIFKSMLLIAALLLTGCSDNKQRTVCIATTPDAFDIRRGAILIEIRNGHTFLHLSMTPAPWPSEAKKIMDYVKSGNKVNVVVKVDQSSVQVPIVGISPENDFIIEVSSETEARGLLQLLGFRDAYTRGVKRGNVVIN